MDLRQEFLNSLAEEMPKDPKELKAEGWVNAQELAEQGIGIRAAQKLLEQRHKEGKVERETFRVVGRQNKITFYRLKKGV